MYNRFRPSLFTAADRVVSTGCRDASLFLRPLVHHSRCLGWGAACGTVPGLLPSAKTRLWSLAHLKVCYLLLVCRNLCQLDYRRASYRLTSLAEGGSWEAETNLMQ